MVHFSRGEAASRPCAQADARCPHLVFRDVLGTEAVADLLDHVMARELNFRPALVGSRQSGERRIDLGLRDCLYLEDLGEFEALIKTCVRNAARA
jgi:hypothetical protein